MDGLIVVDKPVGPTSHDVVARMRRVLGERRIGHTGTLDPAASGVLPLVIGRATRLARFFDRDLKRYEAEIRLGVETDTYDAAGQPTRPAYDGPLPERDVVERALDAFRGTFLQRPPPYSAKKVAGRRSYLLARAARRAAAAGLPGTESSHPVPEAVSVTVHALQLVGMEGDRVRLRLDCSAGFYVRALAHDLGHRLGTGAHLSALRRTQSGDLTEKDAGPLELIASSQAAAMAALIPLSGMLRRLAAVELTGPGVERARRGRDLEPADVVRWVAGTSAGGAGPRHVRLIDERGELLGIGAEAAGGFLHPFVVLG
jgi:tRNA pseudouridine55 synthase